MDETCGGCRFFKTSRERDDGRLGECRLGKVMGVFHEGMRACPAFSRAGGEAAEPGGGAAPAAAPRREIRAAGHGPVATASRVSSTALAGAIGALSSDRLRLALSEALSAACLAESPELGRGWTSGELQLVPREDDLKAKQVPLDAFFHKLVMIRDNLRVMEQKVNSHEQLQDAQKLDLQRHILLAYMACTRLASGFLDRGPSDESHAELWEMLRTLRVEAERQSLAMAPPPLGERWARGEVRYTREGEAVTEPIEHFYHRLCVLRDRLLGLEALLGAHPHVGPDEADAMCGYIRRCYGSLTSFNLLFREREDYFTSSR